MLTATQIGTATSAFVLHLLESRECAANHCGATGAETARGAVCMAQPPSSPARTAAASWLLIGCDDIMVQALYAGRLEGPLWPGHGPPSAPPRCRWTSRPAAAWAGWPAPRRASCRGAWPARQCLTPAMQIVVGPGRTQMAAQHGQQRWHQSARCPCRSPAPHAGGLWPRRSAAFGL